MSLRIETHAPGCYTVAGYNPEVRYNDKGQMLACPTVCELYFAEPGKSNGITPEILLEVILRHTGEAPDGKNSAPVSSNDPPKNKGGRPRKNPELETADAA